MLKLSTKSRYATRILVCIQLRDGDSPVTAQDIAETESISSQYVEQIMTRLKTSGIVASHRGLKGGFTLARDADKITVTDVINATEGRIAIAPCIRNECSRMTACVTRNVWQTANDALDKVFAETTIKSLAEQAKNLSKSGSLHFDI